ncbi:beta-carotene ketolase CrtO [Leptolyngbya sp. KIOST-1]|uniref:beta-carotene ketolase CrtO n=1 Tax=Leptolyngbya sp. KIOST-1 TaxID=1229172 RepID=UPI000567F1E7|nr:NAD(P)/FAD-dependent oxidoreductase [Leptolyngbya sp. KIOST-1]
MQTTQTFDVVIIGAGHNGLVCAGYLLKAGYSVLLLEKREIPGGAATTEEALPEDAPGFYFNLCAIDHEFIHLGPVVDELELERYGLEYLYCDPITYCPQADGKAFLAYRSVEKTCAEIARYSQRDADQYKKYMAFWDTLTQAITPVFNAPPKSVVDILGNYGLHNMQDLLSLVGGVDQALDLVRTMLNSPQDTLNEWFETEVVKAPLARLASELGGPPSQKTLAVGSMMMALRHNPGVARPRGGTGALVDALVRMVKDHGGTILCDQSVDRLLIDAQGRVEGVRVASGQEYRATKGVISNIDAQRVFQDLVPAADAQTLVPELSERLDRRIVNNNEGILKIDCALSEMPRFEGHDHRDDYLIGSVLIADTMDQVETAHTMPTQGLIPDDDPSLYVVVPTVMDPSMAPAGQHTLWIEFFAPFQVKGAEGTGLLGTGWTDDLKNKVADRVIDKLAHYTPNLKQSIIARRVESPAELTQRIGVRKGNHYHIDMTLDQMVFFRPLPELANYQTPLSGLFLTGAGTHPGGSISGMPGRNCARVFLSVQEPLKYNLKEAGNWLKDRFKSVASLSR